RLNKRIGDKARSQLRQLHLQHLSRGKKFAHSPIQSGPRKQMLTRATGCKGVRHRAAGYSLARPKYSPVRVSTRTTSPIFINKGTLTTAPVVRVAGLVPPWAVSPFKPGSVCTTSNSTWLGGVMASGALLYRVTVHLSC